MSSFTARLPASPRIRWIAGALLIGAFAVWQFATAHGGTPNPADPSTHLSRGAVVIDSGILVLREGLETILVLAAVTASMRGTASGLRRPIATGGAAAFLATVATWFAAIALTDQVGATSLDLQAATGLLAVAVLLVVMNWFFHKIYWTGWIQHHNGRKRRLAADAAGGGDTARRAVLGLALLGFTSVYREGFEVVLFLQNLRLRYGGGVVLEGVAIGLALVAAIGYVTFRLHHKLPYKRMLIVTGVMLGVVLLVMVGESVQELQMAHWIGVTDVGLTVPGWLGLWFSVFPNVESIAAQLAAAVFVIGSYVLAERLKSARPRRRRRARGKAAPPAAQPPASRRSAAPVLP